jgi:hypothetical protein
VPSSPEPAPRGVAPLTAPRAATSASTPTRWVASTVPPGFLPRVAPTTHVAPRVDSVAPATSCVAPTTPATPREASMTPASPAQFPGSPPRVWPSSPIAYICHPRQPAAPTAHAPLTSTMLMHRPVTAVPMTPLVNPHRMSTCTKVVFRMPQDPLILATTTTSSRRLQSRPLFLPCLLIQIGVRLWRKSVRP